MINRWLSETLGRPRRSRKLPVHGERNQEAATPPLGQLPFFVDFRKIRVACLRPSSPRIARCAMPVPTRRRGATCDVLHPRRTQVLRPHCCAAVLPELLGMKKVVSEDAARAADDNPPDQLTCTGKASRQGARNGRGVLARLDRKCAAVDRTTKMARHPGARLPGLPESSPLWAPPRRAPV